MIRQLSLVAYLMARRGRKIDAHTIKYEVEGYGGEYQGFESFTRRFYADREELAELGIVIASEPDPYGDGDVYWLPEENFYLPRIDFTPGELAALHTCLYLLDGKFAYSRLLRPALQSLALGTGNPLEDPETDFITVQPHAFGGEAVAARQARIEKAISRRKTIVFDYHSFSSDRVESRRVDPYGQVHTRGGWYLVGYSHEREGIRMFKLDRIRGKIRNATAAEHDFDVPGDFRLRDYLNLEPWQLGPPRGEAEVHVSPRLGWKVAGVLSRSAEVSLDESGAAVLRTSYANGDRLCSMVLGLGEDATLAAPAKLRRRMLHFLERIEELHSGPPPEAAAVAAEPETEKAEAPAAGPAPQVEPERFSLLAQTASYLVSRLGDESSVTLPVAEVTRDLGLDRHELEQAVELLYMVSSDFGQYLVEAVLEGDELRVDACPDGELLRRPVRLSPREARALLLAIDLVGEMVLSGEFPSLESARRKIVAAAAGGDEAVSVARSGADFEVCRTVNTALRERRLLEIEYLSKEGRMPEPRVVEPYLLTRSGEKWYLVAWCRKRDDLRTFIIDMIKSARLLDEHFEPRDLDLDRFRRHPRRPSGSEPPKKARVLFSDRVARWVAERRPGGTLLEDGSLLEELAYFDDRWLRDEILGYAGEAVVLAPEDMRRRIAADADALAGRYR